MPFWSDDFGVSTAMNDPKRKFRFKVNFMGISKDGGMLWYAKTATKPSFQISAAEHKYLNHTFYYPGSVTWQDVTITLVDPVDPDMAATLSDIVTLSGYKVPSDYTKLSTISKAKSVGGLGSVVVTQIDSNGGDLEKWTLQNAFITEVKYGDLEYGGEEITELSLTLKYDWAELVTAGKSVAAGGGNEFFAV